MRHLPPNRAGAKTLVGPELNGIVGHRARPVIQPLVMCEHDVCDSLSMVAALGMKPRVAGRYGPPF